MSFDMMKRKGIPLPPSETEEGLTANDIMHLIRSFYFRKDKCTNSEITEFADTYFLDLLKDYPKSMCSQHLTETMKQLIALMYFESKPETDTDHTEAWPGYSYEHLALYFCRSKSTIYEAINQKEAQAKQLLEDAKLHSKAKTIALEQLVKEEKEKLELEQNKRENQPNNQTNTHLPPEEDICKPPE